MSRVLLTGASGFVGRQALAALCTAGHEVHALGRTRGPDAPGVSWHCADLLGGCELVPEIGAEVLVHLAWYAEHRRFWTSQQNVPWVGASLSLLQAFAQGGGRRAVIAGSCAEYEWSREIYAEDAPLVPATLYGAAKHGLDVVASALCEQLDVALAWGRLFFLYGPFESPERFVPSLIRPLMMGEPASMTAGTQRRDFLHSADAGAAFAALADSEITGALNVASGEPVALRDLAHEIARQLDREDLLRIGAVPMRSDDPPVLAADVSRLHQELGWKPRLSLVEGINDVIAWWREHPVADPPAPER